MAALQGAALLVLGLGALVVGLSLPGAKARVVGHNLPVNQSASEARDISANNSPSLDRNPLDAGNLAVANRIDSPAPSCALHASFDGGGSWAPSTVPFPAGEELPARCFAPDVAFGPDGTLFLSYLTLRGPANQPGAGWVATSGDGGRTLSPPVRVADADAFHLSIAADGSRPGRLYVAWLQTTGVAGFGFPDVGNPVRVRRSDDGGRTWHPPVTVSSPGWRRALAPTVAVGPDGAVHVVFLDLGEDALDYHAGHAGNGGEPHPGPWSLVLARSADSGTMWQETVVDAGLKPIERFVPLLPPTPALAVDAEGKVVVVFHDRRAGDADVWVWASDDGARFDAPVRVNDTPQGDGTSQYLPGVDVAPGGRVDVVYYDRRADPANVMNEVSVQSSLDGGRSFGPRLRTSDRSFDSRIGFGLERNLPDLGGRLDLAASDERTVVVWTDTRAGSEGSGKQDLATAAVAFDDANAWRRPLRFGGAILAGLGFGVVALATRPRRRTDHRPDDPREEAL